MFIAYKCEKYLMQWANYYPHSAKLYELYALTQNSLYQIWFAFKYNEWWRSNINWNPWLNVKKELLIKWNYNVGIRFIFYFFIVVLLLSSDSCQRFYLLLQTTLENSISLLLILKWKCLTVLIGADAMFYCTFFQLSNWISQRFKNTPAHPYNKLYLTFSNWLQR